ncbi:MAG: hypothetical protein M1819_000704 [Sarea resinae]|nr:MAG: hypothetical protein M1819_000704 [Sarea resinae]
MPPVGGKGKGKGRDARRSRSRNTTPSSIGTGPGTNVPASNPASSAFLEIPISSLMVPSNISYEDILERHGSGNGIPDTKHLETLAADLKTLAQLAEVRGQACDKGMRELSKRRKEIMEQDRERERADREMEERREKLRREAAAVEEEEEGPVRKAGKLKRRNKSKVHEERPLAHGAHGVARQDGMDTQMKDTSGSPEQRKALRSNAATPTRVKREAASASTSSLSPPSQAQTPIVAAAPEVVESRPNSPTPSSSSDDSRQPPPAPAIPQYQTFGPDPSTFDDPTIYHIREVKPGMSEEEIKEIYSVTSYPHDDLSDLIAGDPPDKDFSNAKPTNQVSANTFAAYIEPYVRPLTEEDMAFLKERGDRATPFLLPRRGKRHYTEVWAEADGSITLDGSSTAPEKFPANQPRGGIEQMNDEVAESEAVSAGPVLSRLLSTLRFEGRDAAHDDKSTNGSANGAANGEALMNGFGTGDAEGPGEGNKAEPLPPAAFIPDSTQPGWKVPTTKMDHKEVDERLKAELRHMGFLGPEEPDYDAHYDDDVAARLRFLQSELKKQMIVNGARKARIQDLAKERMAHQEYTTIRDDLDNQVQQAYLKRTRTLGKGKKHAKRPGGAGGGSHYVGGGPGISKPGIGDFAKQLMERRKKWIDSIGPVFEPGLTKVPGKDESIFDQLAMKTLLEKEQEGWDETEE